MTDVLGFGGDLARVGHTRLGAGVSGGPARDSGYDDRCVVQFWYVWCTVRESGFRNPKGIVTVHAV